MVHTHPIQLGLWQAFQKCLKSTIIVWLIALAISNNKAQAQVMFNKAVFVPSYALQQTVDHGYILAGGSSDLYLTKLDSLGVPTWGKTISFYDTTGITAMLQPHYTRAIRQTTDKGYIIAGDVYNGIATEDFFLAKTDSNGIIQWQQSWGNGINFAYGHSVQQTTDGGYIIAGIQNAYPFYSSKFCVVKTDSLGNMLWTKSYLGSTGCESIRQTADGGYIFAGSSSRDSIRSDFALVKTDGAGNVTWAKRYGGGPRGNNNAYAVVQTTDGGYAVAGSTDSMGASLHDAYLVKTDGSGNLQWSKTYNGLGDDGAFVIWQTSDHGYILSGATVPTSGVGGGTYLIRTDSIGVMLWSKKYALSSSPFSYSVQQTSDGGYVTNADGIIKTNAVGNSCNQVTLTNNNATPLTAVTSFTLMVTSDMTNRVVDSVSFTIGATDSTRCTPVTSAIENKSMDPVIEVFPNPSDGAITINSASSLYGADICIIDPVGKICYQHHITDTKNNIEVNMQSVGAGIYYYQITKEDRIICWGKLSTLR